MNGKITLVVAGFAAGLVVALLLAFILVQEKTEVEKQLVVCENELEGAKQDIERIGGELDSCRVELEARDKTIEELERSLTEAKNNLEKLGAKLTDAQETIAKLTSELEHINKEYSSLESLYENLQEKYSSLNESYSSLKLSYRKLSEKYNETISELEKLQLENEDLRESYAELQRDYKNLESKYNNLAIDHNELKTRYNNLVATYNQLKRDYSSLQRLYRDIASAINETLQWLGISVGDEKTFYTSILTASTEEVKWIVDLAEFWGSLGQRSHDAFVATLYWFYYCNDSYVRYVNPLTGAVGVRQEVLMLPNETWSSGCGDCDDLALFVYSILRATARSNEKIYLVAFYPPEGPGHMGVLAVEKTPNGNRYYVVDPAGNYFNSIMVFIELRLTAPNGTKWVYYLNPLSISYGEKKYLLEYSRLIFYDYFEEKIYTIEDVPIYYYTDVFAALQDWIVDYWGERLVGEIIIIGEDIYEEFTSIIDAAKWIEQNT